MKHIRKFLAALITCAILISVIPISAFAYCSHSSLGDLYCEASHPHAYFRICNSCGATVYTGGYETKSHGSGAWGSGTCPSCGTHTFTWPSCTSSGACACGATTGALGHSYGELYSDAEHPHGYFRICSSCSVKTYTGGYETKSHGSGAWGSGTCPSCGTHTYTGRTCSSSGVCVCGALISPLGHSYSGTVYYETAHPHRNFQYCSRCSEQGYTGETTTLPHGDGSLGTCGYCGSHSYSIQGIPQSLHPHETSFQCDCGSSYSFFPLSQTCSSCTANSNIAYSSTPTTGVLSYIDSDQNSGSLILVPIQYYVEYTNTYNHPSENFSLYDYPPFASFTSIVTSHAEGQAAYVPPIVPVSNLTVIYYNSSETPISSQSMNWNANFDAIAQPGVHQISANPTYTVSYATCNISGFSSFVTGSTTTYFS